MSDFDLSEQQPQEGDLAWETDPEYIPYTDDGFREVREFPFGFYENDFSIVLGNDRQLWLPIPLICGTLRVHPGAQIRRILRDESMDGGMRMVEFAHYPYGDEGEYRPRTVQALRLDLLPYFLGGIDTNRIDDPVRRKEVVRFKKEFQYRAWAAFRSEILGEDVLAELDAYLPPEQQAYLQSMDYAQTLRQDNEENKRRIKRLEDTVQRIEAKLLATNTLNAQQIKQAQTMISLVAKQIERKGLPDPYGQVHGGIREEFGVGSYAQIPEDQFPHLRDWLAQWFRQLTPKGTALPGIFKTEQRRLI